MTSEEALSLAARLDQPWCVTCDEYKNDQQELAAACIRQLVAELELPDRAKRLIAEVSAERNRNADERDAAVRERDDAVKASTAWRQTDRARAALAKLSEKTT